MLQVIGNAVKAPNSRDVPGRAATGKALPPAVTTTPPRITPTRSMRPDNLFFAFAPSTHILPVKPL